jgi:hypothetical protein
MSERSIYLRDQAEKCLRHADAMGDVQTQTELRKLAAEYVTRAADRCKTAAVLAYLFTEQNLKYLGVPDHKLCFSVDVFGGKAHATPNTYKKKLDYIQSSCEEVALRWAITSPPADYDGPSWT